MSIQLFGNNFNYLRENYVFPLIGYGIKRNKYSYWGLKGTITTKLKSLKKLTSRNIVEIELSEEDFTKSLLCEIELFLNKTVIQYSTLTDTGKKSKTWSYVTLYYFFFFSATTLMRFLRQGFIFMNSEQIKNLNKYSEVVNSEAIQLKSGNYFFSVKGTSPEGNIIITLESKGEGVHRMTWLHLESLIREFVLNSDEDEKLVYEQILGIIKEYEAEYPSILRNKLNYTGESSMLDLEGSIPFIELNEIKKNFINNFLALQVEQNDKSMMLGVAHYALFIFNLTLKLYGEYKERSDHGKDFQEERDHFMKSNKIVFAEL